MVNVEKSKESATDSLYIVLPAFNEQENIEMVVRQWYPNLAGKSEHSRLVVADSGSSDRTHDILLRLKDSDCPLLEILETDSPFHGPKLIALYEYAISQGADYIFQTDSDGQTAPEEFEAFWELRKEYDGIFGNRTIRGDGKSRAFVERVVCLLLRLYFGVAIPDANAPFRLMKAETVEKYIKKLPQDYALPNIMLTTYFSYFGERILFPQISFKPRAAGKNSINIRKIVKIGWKSLQDFREFKKSMKTTVTMGEGKSNEKEN